MFKEKMEELFLRLRDEIKDIFTSNGVLYPVALFITSEEMPWKVFPRPLPLEFDPQKHVSFLKGFLPELQGDLMAVALMCEHRDKIILTLYCRVLCLSYTAVVDRKTRTIGEESLTNDLLFPELKELLQIAN